MILLWLAISISMLILIECYHWITFMLLYEMLILICLPFLTINSNSIRKGWAVTVLYIVLVCGVTSLIITLLIDIVYTVQLTPFDWLRINGLGITILLILLIKTPTWPVLFWLPEAHVEATWIGSIILACLILKYSIFGIVMFLHGSILQGVISNILLLLLLTLGWITLALIPHTDLNRIGALLSIIHMNTGLLAYLWLGCTGNYIAADFWLAHTVTALLWFWWVGFTYALTGTSTINCITNTNLLCIISSCIILSQLGLPIGILFVGELSLFIYSAIISSGAFLVVIITILLTIVSIISSWWINLVHNSELRYILLDAGSVLLLIFSIGIWLFLLIFK